MTTTPAVDRPTASARYRRSSASLIVGAPLVMALGRVLLVPFDDQEVDAMFTDMATHQARSDLGWVLAVVACGLLGTSAAMLASELRARHPKMAAFGLISTAVGWAATASIAGGMLILPAMAEADDRSSQVQVVEDFNGGASVGFVFLLVAIGAIGYVVLAIGLGRSHIASKGAAVLIGVGGATTLLTTPGPLTPLLVATAVVLAVGHSLTLRSLSDAPDDHH